MRDQTKKSIVYKTSLWMQSEQFTALLHQSDFKMTMEKPGGMNNRLQFFLFLFLPHPNQQPWDLSATRSVL